MGRFVVLYDTLLVLIYRKEKKLTIIGQQTTETGMALNIAKNAEKLPKTESERKTYKTKSFRNGVKTCYSRFLF